MPSARHYPRAPITEALVDLRVSYPEGMSLERLKQFGDRVRNRYPSEATRDVFQAEIKLGQGASSTNTTLGFVYHSADRLQAVQARLDGFTFSRFTPYETWDLLIAEARRLWALFVETAAQCLVQRVAVRYINRLDLPIKDGRLRFEDYLRTFPVVGAEAGQEMEGFLVRLMLPQRDIAAKLVLTEALVPQQHPGVVGVILDIDLFRDGVSLPGDSKEVWDILEAFHDRKNLYFEASITDSARELFQ